MKRRPAPGPGPASPTPAVHYAEPLLASVDPLSPTQIRQRRAFEIAEAALEHSPGTKRDTALDAAIGDDDALRAEVEALLDADSATHTLLDRGAAHLLPDEVPPAVLGDYRITGELGRGGMGVVYDAERADGSFEQRVAVKVVRDAGRSASRTAERFEQERRVLARLTHPGIARLLGGGVTDDARPYFILEYVDGVPITEATAPLDLDARLRLFVQVCDAVAHAHRLLIVHRDIKPSNVLVETTDDGALRARLLDFGIAKALDESDPDITRTAAPLTPAYAAPEQVTGEPVTAATDVYALGMLLYEILTGRRAYGFGDGSMAEIARAVCETVPARPSATTETAASAPSDAASPGPGVPPSALRGDLDAIVLQAIHKDPARRYATAADLADDLRRHLEHRPVEARGDSLAYRTTRFLRRNRVASTAAGVAVLAAVAGVVGVADQARSTALEAERTQATLDWVLGTFDSIDPEALDGEQIDARDIIRPGLARIRDLDAQPLVQASVMEGLGRLSLSLGLVPTADTLFSDAIRVRTRAQGAAHPDVATVRLLLAASLRDARAYADAETEARRALDVLTGDARGPALYALGTALSRQEREAEAEVLLRDAIRIARATGDLNLELEAAGELGNQLTYDAARIPEAVSVLEDAAARAVAAHGPLDPRTARAWRGLAYAVEQAGDAGRAADLLERDLAVTRAAYGDDDHRVAQGLYALGRLRMLAEDYAEAARLYADADAAFAASGLDDDHLWRAYALIGRGRAETELGDAEAAQAHLRQGLALYARTLPENDYRVLAAQGALGLARIEGGDAGGRTQLARSWQAMLAQLDENPYVGQTARPLGEALRDLIRRDGEAAALRRIEAQLAGLDA